MTRQEKEQALITLAAAAMSRGGAKTMTGVGEGAAIAAIAALKWIEAHLDTKELERQERQCGPLPKAIPYRYGQDGSPA